jgi:molecular chaperone DnaK
MQIIPSSGLSDNEIDQMVQDADRHKEEDTQRKSHIEARNQADSLVFAAEKTLGEQGEQISGELKSEVEGKIEATKKALEQDDPEAIKQATADLGQILQQIGTEMYGTDGPGTAGAGPEPGAGDQAAADGGAPDESGPGDEDVVEGEFTEAS